MALAISYEDVLQAQKRIAPYIHHTPVMTSRTLNELTGCEVFLKCENFQRAGSFKIRGATNKLLSLTPEQRQCGVVAFSSGNHAQGVALAARTLGIPATIVMPGDAPAAKLAATRGYGAEVVLYDRQHEDREEIARRLVAKSGRTLVPPYDDSLIMAGQGTAYLELLAETPRLDALLTPVGGGGLMAGCSTVAHHQNPAMAIWGVEPELGDDVYQSFQLGRRIKIDLPNTIADGARTQQPGALTFPLLQANLRGILLASEAEIGRAVRFLLFRMKILIEPTGALALAALMAGKLPAKAARVGVVLSGGNVDAEVLAGIMAQMED